MSFLDIILLVPIVWLTIKGFRRGFILELVSLIALFAGIWAAFHFSFYARDLLDRWFTVDEKYMPAISFVVTFAVVAVVIILIGKLADKFVEMLAMGPLNKILGAIFGILKAVLLLGIIIYLIDSFDTREKLVTPKAKEKSFLYVPLSKVIPTVIPYVRKLRKEEEKKEEKQAPEDENQFIVLSLEW